MFLLKYIAVPLSIKTITVPICLIGSGEDEEIFDIDGTIEECFAQHRPKENEMKTVRQPDRRRKRNRERGLWAMPPLSPLDSYRHTIISEMVGSIWTRIVPELVPLLWAAVQAVTPSVAIEDEGPHNTAGGVITHTLEYGGKEGEIIDGLKGAFPVRHQLMKRRSINRHRGQSGKTPSCTLSEGAVGDSALGVTGVKLDGFTPALSTLNIPKISSYLPMDMNTTQKNITTSPINTQKQGHSSGNAVTKRWRQHRSRRRLRVISPSALYHRGDNKHDVSDSIASLHPSGSPSSYMIGKDVSVDAFPLNNSSKTQPLATTIPVIPMGGEGTLPLISAYNNPHGIAPRVLLQMPPADDCLVRYNSSATTSLHLPQIANSSAWDTSTANTFTGSLPRRSGRPDSSPSIHNKDSNDRGSTGDNISIIMKKARQFVEYKRTLGYISPPRLSKSKFNRRPKAR